MQNNDLKNKNNPLIPPPKEDKKQFDKGFWIGFIICFIINCLICGGVILYEVTTLISNWEIEKWTVLVDGFTVSGGFMCLVYLLVWVSGEGAFDAIAYGVQLAYYTTFHKNIRETKLPKTYTDYRLLKRGKDKANVKFMLLSGGIFFLIGLVLLIPYFIKG